MRSFISKVKKGKDNSHIIEITWFDMAIGKEKIILTVDKEFNLTIDANKRDRDFVNYVLKSLVDSAGILY